MRARVFASALLYAIASASTDWKKYITDGVTNIDNFPDLLHADLNAINAGLSTSLFTSVDLVQAYLARIEEVQDELHVVNELNPDALETAAERDAQRLNGTILGPLHGIPVLLKDNIATHDKMNNTAGSHILLGAKVPRDATVAAKLRKAGAILLGKSNLSQWMQFRSANTTSGWSAYGGQCKGAYVEDQEPNGSSSGSAVATSLGLAFAALGTETLGSLVFPAEVNNVVAIKPTVGLTSRHLVVPISERQDTIGPIARTVKDAATVLQAIAGTDPRDNYTSAIPNDGAIPDYVAACREDSLSGVQIGIPYNVIALYSDALEPSLLPAFENAVEQIAAAGATIVEANFTAFEDFQYDQNNSLVLQGDFVSGLSKYLAELVDVPTLKNLSDVRNQTQSNPAEDYPGRDTLIWDVIIASEANNTSPKFWQAYQDSLVYGDEGGVLGALRRSNASAILLPTQFSAALPAIVGSPIITVPMGAYDNSTTKVMDERGSLVRTAPGVPFGLAFLGDLWSEADLIGYAYAYEQKTKNREKLKPLIFPKTSLADIKKNATTQSSDGTGSGTTSTAHSLNVQPALLNTMALGALIGVFVIECFRPF
ncbi:hypothetical protein CKM354_000240200 [Cercospora kikuchii]|uniref:Amidase domain-containing protein n=1 Tax=Cercospora kikuchii TaxID=84275 RepID=A0A9P3CFJ2_9PEZI|nr:uncharacterized protein CKM354_000240200 [Cercospora kikuchii]GIZ39010.1 hypothetical protein CKM354_000240200 [Cercospora kikuchii]